MGIIDVDEVQVKLNNYFKLINSSINFKITYNDESDQMIITSLWNRLGTSIYFEGAKSFYFKSRDYQNCFENKIKPFFLNKNSEFYAEK